MTTFGFKKDVEDIKDAVVMPKEWYAVRVLEDPQVLPNNAKKAGKAYEDGAGDNLVVKVAVMHEMPEFDGRKFTLYLPYPEDKDQEEYDGRGMVVYDAKMERIVGMAKAAGGMVMGDTVDISSNMTFQVLVEQAIDKMTQKLVNNVNTFAGFKAVQSDQSDGMLGGNVPVEEETFDAALGKSKKGSKK